MRRWTALFALMLAASVAQAKDLKIGTVDLQKLFTQYPGTKKMDEKFNGLFKKQMDDLAAKKRELSELNEELNASKSVLSKKKLKDKTYLLQKKFEDYQKQEADLQVEVNNKKLEITGDILSKIKAIVAGVAKDKGVDLVLDSEKTVFARDGVDLTDAVLKNYKKAAADSKDEDEDSKK